MEERPLNSSNPRLKELIKLDVISSLKSEPRCSAGSPFSPSRSSRSLRRTPSRFSDSNQSFGLEKLAVSLDVGAGVAAPHGGQAFSWTSRQAPPPASAADTFPLPPAHQPRSNVYAAPRFSVGERCPSSPQLSQEGGRSSAGSELNSDLLGNNNSNPHQTQSHRLDPFMQQRSHFAPSQNGGSGNTSFDGGGGGGGGAAARSSEGDAGLRSDTATRPSWPLSDNSNAEDMDLFGMED